MNVVKFSTKEEAETRQQQCLIDWLVHHPKVGGYNCDRWDEPRQRIDGDWTIEACPHTDHSGDTVILYAMEDYPSEE